MANLIDQIVVASLGEFEGVAEPFFSWSPCDCCDNPEGGNRWDVVYKTEIKGEMYLGQFCETCTVRVLGDDNA